MRCRHKKNEDCGLLSFERPDFCDELCEEFVPADLAQPVASAERICSVIRLLPSQEEIDKAIDDYGFQVPYDGSNEFYDKERMKHFKAGIDFVMNSVKRQ